jgi:hypothetical protein
MLVGNAGTPKFNVRNQVNQYFSNKTCKHQDSIIFSLAGHQVDVAAGAGREPGSEKQLKN